MHGATIKTESVVIIVFETVLELQITSKSRHLICAETFHFTTRRFVDFKISKPSFGLCISPFEYSNIYETYTGYT